MTFAEQLLVNGVTYTAREFAERERAQQASLLALVREGDASDDTDGLYGSILDGLDMDPFPG